MNKTDRARSYTVSLKPAECDSLKRLGEGSLTKAVRKLFIAYLNELDQSQSSREVECGDKSQ